MKFVTRLLVVSSAALSMAIGACSDSGPTSPRAYGDPGSHSFGESGLGSSVTFHPGNTSDPGGSAEASIDALQRATQGVAFKLRIRGDVFTGLRGWDSRTLFSIDDGSFAGRKVELVVERDDRDRVRLVANWSHGVVVQSEFFSVSSVASSAEYVIYAHYNDAASPQRELALSDSTGGELQRATASYAAGELGASGANGAIHVAKGLSNWSASGTFDGLAVYAFAGARILSGLERFQAPTTADPGIVSLIGFDEGAGLRAANAVAGAPALLLQDPQWSPAGSWRGGTATQPVGSGLSGSGLASFQPGNSAGVGAVAMAPIARLDAAAQGVVIKMRIRGDIFTRLNPWDSRTLMAISDGTYSGRKVELIVERDDQNRVQLRSRWSTQEIATPQTSVQAFDAARYYVIYAHYNDFATPQRELIIFDDAGGVVGQRDQDYTAGPLTTNGGSSVVSIATGLNTWSANGTVDGFGVYVMDGSMTLTGSARSAAPTAGDVGIVSLVTFDEGGGPTAANSVSGAPAMAMASGTWASGGSWGVSTLPAPAPTGSSPSPVQSAPHTHEPSYMTPLISYDAGGSLPGHTSLGVASFYNFNGYNGMVTDATAPTSPGGVLRFVYPGGAGHDFDPGQTATEPGNLFMPFHESTEFYESGSFRVGDLPDFEMLDIVIWKPLGFFGNGNPAAKAGILQANQLYAAAWVHPDAQGRITGFRLGFGNQTSQSEGLNWSYSYGNDLNGYPAGGAASAGLSIDPHPEIPVGQWIQYEIYLKTNAIYPAVADDGVLKMWASWGGHNYLILNRNDVRFRTQAFPLGFFNRQLAPTFGGTSAHHELRSRFDYLYFDDIYVSGNSAP